MGRERTLSCTERFCVLGRSPKKKNEVLKYRSSCIRSFFVRLSDVHSIQQVSAGPANGPWETCARGPGAVWINREEREMEESTDIGGSGDLSSSAAATINSPRLGRARCA